MCMRSLADAFDTSFGNEIGRRILGELTCQLRTSNLGHWTPNCWQRKRNCTARIMQEAEDVLGWRECMCNLVETKELIRSSFYLTPFDRRQTDLRLSLRLTTRREPSNCRPIDTDYRLTLQAESNHEAPIRSWSEYNSNEMCQTNHIEEYFVSGAYVFTQAAVPNSNSNSILSLVPRLCCHGVAASLIQQRFRMETR